MHPTLHKMLKPTVGLGIAAVTTLAAFIVGGHSLYNQVTEETTEARVNQLTVKPGKKSGYLVMTNKEVFENDDEWSKLKFNSSDMQNSLKEGHTYKFKTIGKRIPLFSKYKNIITATDVTPKASAPADTLSR